MSVETEFKTNRELVLHALEHYPETRNNDNVLYFRCCSLLGADTLEELKTLNLSIISIHKMRQKIQNKEHLFLPDEKIIELRQERAEEIRDYMRRN